MRSKGLTLTELLIVIGIISVLVSLVIGVVRLGINVARKVQCINNLRQIYKMTKLYEEEYDSPPFRAIHFINQYPNMKQIVICPSDPYQGYEDIAQTGYANYEEIVKKYPNFVPFSYEPIYWTWHWMLRIKPHFKTPEDEKDWYEILKIIQQRIDKPDMPVVLCKFHDIAIFRDGNVGRASPIRLGPPSMVSK